MALPTSSELLALSKREPHAQKRIRLLAVAHFQDGMNRSQIALALKVSRASVNRWVGDFLKGGVTALSYPPRPGRPPRLTPDQQRALAEYVNKHAVSQEGGRLTGVDLNIFIEQQFGINYEPSHIYRVLKKLGFSWLTSRSRHPKQSNQVQEDFKKIPN